MGFCRKLVYLQSNDSIMPDSHKHPTKKVYPSALEDIAMAQVKEEDGNTQYPTAPMASGHSDVDRLSGNALEMLERMSSFAKLPENWDSYGAGTPTVDAIQAGKIFIEQLAEQGQQVDFTAPGPNGEVSVELKSGSKYMEFVFYPAGKWRYTAFDNKVLVKQGSYETKDLPSLLRWTKLI